MSGSGITNAEGGLTIGGTAANTTYQECLAARSLNNYGTATLAGTYNNSGLFSRSGATLDNEPGASFDIADTRRSGPTAAARRAGPSSTRGPSPRPRAPAPASSVPTTATAGLWRSTRAARGPWSSSLAPWSSAAAGRSAAVGC